MCMSKVWTTWQDNGAVAAEGSPRYTTPCSASPAAPAGRDAAGTLAFPDHFPPIFWLPQNLLNLAFNATKSQPHSPRIWRRVRRIFAKLAKERKEAKEVLWEFLGFDDDAGDEVGICAEVLMLRKWFEEWILCFDAKSPPHDISAAWMFAVIPRLRRAPNPCLRVAG